MASFCDIFDSTNLPTKKTLLLELEAGIFALKKDKKEYRKNLGGLLDFRKCSSCVTILVPDIHARWFFLQHILDFMIDTPLGRMTVLAALKAQVARVICLGDAFHSESPQYERWQYAYKEFERGEYCGPSMTQEMLDNIKVIRALLLLKSTFPSCFHFLKGNHDNIMNATNQYDRGFYKFCAEGKQVKLFLANYYDDLVLHTISSWESYLPLIAVGPGFVASHAEPRFFYTEKQLIDYKKGTVIYDLTWTDNNVVKTNTAQNIIRQFFLQKDFPDLMPPYYFAGHRAVQKNYALRQEGLFVQIHNPLKQNIAIIDATGHFDLQKDIVSVL